MKKSESTKYYQASSLVRLTIHWWWRCKFIQPVNLVKLSIHIQCTAILPSHLLWRTLYLWTSRHAQGCPDSRDSNSKQRKIEMTRSLLSKRFSETLSASFHHLSGTHRPCCEEVIQIKRLRVREDIGALHWITWHRAADPTANPTKPVTAFVFPKWHSKDSHVKISVTKVASGESDHFQGCIVTSRLTSAQEGR